MSPLLFAIVVDVITEEAREGLMNEILYADELVLISENIDDLRKKFIKWKDAFERKGMKVNIGKTKLMVSGEEGERTNSNIDPCGICGKRVMANSVWCSKCGKWIHGRCTRMKRITPSMAKDFVCKKCKKSNDGLWPHLLSCGMGLKG